MTTQTDYLRDRLQGMIERGEVWNLRQLETPTNPHVTVDGHEVTMLTANNYLDLANDQRLKTAAKEAIDAYGHGTGSVWAIAGYMEIQEQLNQAIAEFKGTEAGLAYQTGFGANAGLLPQLLDEGDVFISDELNHGSIIDGMRLSSADTVIYDHADMASLEEALESVHEEYERMLIVTDGVFSMDGDIAPLDEIQKLAEEYGAMTYVDDAHGEGVLGGGHGTVAEFDLDGAIDFQTGTFSKAMGSFGGMLAADEHVVEYAYNTSRTWLLSAGFPPAVAAANIKALEIVEEETERVEYLWELREYFVSELESMGFDTGNSETPIVPVMVGDSRVAQTFADRLFEEGIFALAIVYPMVARGKARIRNQLNAGLTEDDLNEALRVYETVGRDLDII